MKLLTLLTNINDNFYIYFEKTQMGWRVSLTSSISTGILSSCAGDRDKGWDLCLGER